jgi:hypothetical protein
MLPSRWRLLLPSVPRVQQRRARDHAEFGFDFFEVEAVVGVVFGHVVLGVREDSALGVVHVELGMGEGVLGGDAVVGIFDQHVGNEVASLPTQGLPMFLVEGDIAFLISAEYLVVVAAVEGCGAGETENVLKPPYMTCRMMPALKMSALVP